MAYHHYHHHNRRLLSPYGTINTTITPLGSYKYTPLPLPPSPLSTRIITPLDSHNHTKHPNNIITMFYSHYYALEQRQYHHLI
jgi:hypothetical protein